MKVFIILTLALALTKGSTSVLHHITRRNVGIIRGHDASPGQFPYQVDLTMKNGQLFTGCGGSLISNNWVLTAAHCTINADSVTVLLGSIRLSSPLVKHTVDRKNIINHEDFKRKPLKNDIALIRIPYVEYSKDIQPIQLPKLQSPNETYAGHQSIATGWGATSMDPHQPRPDVLQYTNLTIMSHLDCYKWWGSTVTTSNICVATPNRSSTCFGDSGGPLVEYPSWVQVGVTSFVPKLGCDKGYPAVFVRVTNFLEWIKHHTQISL